MIDPLWRSARFIGVRSVRLARASGRAASGRRTSATMPGAAPFMATRGLSSSAYYALLPFLSVWLIKARDVSGVDTASVLGAAILASRAGSALLPPLLRRFQTRGIVVTANTVAAGLMVLLWAYPGRSADVLAGLVILLGLAMSSATLALKALVAGAYSTTRRLHGYSVLNLAVNVGSGLGPVIGGAITASDLPILPLAVAALEALSVTTALGLPSTKISPTTARRLHRSLRPPRATFLAFVAATSLTWMAYAELFDVFPLYATRTHSPGLASALFVVNAGMIILLQMPVSRWAGRAGRPSGGGLGGVVGGANLILAVGVALLALASGRWWFLAVAGVVLFTLAELVWSPAYDTSVPDFAAPLEPMLGFGLAGLGWGLAESLAAAVGTAFVAQGAGSSAFVVGAVAGVAAAGAVSVLKAPSLHAPALPGRPLAAGS